MVHKNCKSEQKWEIPDAGALGGHFDSSLLYLNFTHPGRPGEVYYLQERPGLLQMHKSCRHAKCISIHRLKYN